MFQRIHRPFSIISEIYLNARMVLIIEVIKGTSLAVLFGVTVSQLMSCSGSYFNREEPVGTKVLTQEEKYSIMRKRIYILNSDELSLSGTKAGLKLNIEEIGSTLLLHTVNGSYDLDSAKLYLSSGEEIDLVPMMGHVVWKNSFTNYTISEGFNKNGKFHELTLQGGDGAEVWSELFIISSNPNHATCDIDENSGFILLK